jgi:hypothetical protein
MGLVRMPFSNMRLQVSSSDRIAHDHLPADPPCVEGADVPKRKSQDVES